MPKTLPIITLISIGVELYYRHAPFLHMTHDAFWKYTMMFHGELPPLVLNYEPHLLKIFGRPLRGLPWNMSDVFGNGTLAGSYYFLFSTVLASSLLTYALIRALFPEHHAWAFAAAALKLVWPANHEVFGNHTLPNHFSEMAFWAAAWLLALRLRSTPPSRGWLSWMQLIGIIICLAASMGPYQTGWPIILLTPLILIHASGLRILASKTARALLVWYATAIFMIGWFVVDLLRYPNRAPSGLDNAPRGIELLSVVLTRLVSALRSALTEPVFVAVSEIWLWPSGGSSTLSHLSPWNLLSVGLITLSFFALYLRLSGQSLSTTKRAWPLQHTRNTGRQSAALWLAFYGLLIVFAGVSLTSLRFDPEFTSRLLQWSSIGSVMIVIAPLVWLTSQGGRARTIGTGIALTAVFSVCLVYMDGVGAGRAVEGEKENVFWRRLIVMVAGVPENSYVVLDNCPAPVSHADPYMSFWLRAMTRTERTYFFCEGRASPTSADGTTGLVVRSDIDVAAKIRSSSLFIPPVHPHGEQRELFLPRDSVLHLRWIGSSGRVEVLNPSVLPAGHRAGLPSKLGNRLFPDLSYRDARL